MRRLLAFISLILCSTLISAGEWIEVREKALSETLRLDGVIEAVRESTVSAQTTGTVTKLPYDVDDRVDAGDLIVKLEDSEQRSRLNQAESALEEAEAGLEDARQNLERVQSLYDRDVATQSDLDQARNRFNGARARVARAEAEVAEAQQQLDYTRVQAPYSGIVTERMVELGESVMMGQPLMRGLSLEQLRVVVSLPQQYADRVRRERRATVTLENGRRLETGEMTFYPYADSSTHSFRLRLRLNEPKGQLFPGTLVRVGIPLDVREALWVPESSLYRRGELRAVFVRGNEDEPRLRQVRVGVSRDGQLEILSGLSSGEQVLREAADR